MEPERDEASSGVGHQRGRNEAVLLVGSTRNERVSCSWIQQRRSQGHRGAQEKHGTRAKTARASASIRARVR